jgi:hypothetical protein
LGVGCNFCFGEKHSNVFECHVLLFDCHVLLFECQCNDYKVQILPLLSDGIWSSLIDTLITRTVPAHDVCTSLGADKLPPNDFLFFAE